MKIRQIVIIIPLLIFLCAVYSCTGRGSGAGEWSGALGMTVREDSLQFRILAPEAQYVSLVGDFSEWMQIPMRHRGDTFVTTIERPYAEYVRYQYIVDDKIRVADPYSTTILHLHDVTLPIDSWIKAELPAYPFGVTHEPVTVKKLEGGEFLWTDQEFKACTNLNLNIYGLEVKNFLRTSEVEGTFGHVAEHADYFKELGINAVLITHTIAEEDNNFPLALDKSLGSLYDFKNLVNTLHGLGIGVMIDVPINYTSLREENIAISHEQTTEYADSVFGYWMERFHVDGFRVQLTAEVTQYAKVMKELADGIWTRNKEAWVMAGGPQVVEEETLAAAGILTIRDIKKEVVGSMLGNKYDVNFGAIDYHQLGWRRPCVVGCCEEEPRGENAKSLIDEFSLATHKDTVDMTERELAASLIILAAPGPKIIWQHHEAGSSYQKTHDPVMPHKLLDKKYVSSPQGNSFFRALSIMLNVRKRDYLKYSAEDYNANLGSQLKTIQLRSENSTLLAISNFDKKPRTFLLPNAETSEWREMLDGRTYTTLSTGRTLVIEPGTGMLFLSRN